MNFYPSERAEVDFITELQCFRELKMHSVMSRMYSIKNLLVFTSILAGNNIFMPNDAAIQPAALEIEAVYP